MSVLLTLSAGPLACMLLPMQLHRPRTIRMSTSGSDNMRDVIAATEKGVKAQLAFRARGQELGLLKAKGESTEHVLMKALLWALFLPTAPDALAEVQVGHRYRPGVPANADSRAHGLKVDTAACVRRGRCSGALRGRHAVLVGRVRLRHI